jgi:hypothetical protein
MRYRVSFEIEVHADRDPAGWDWRMLLSSADDDVDKIDWSSVTLEKFSGWSPVTLDFI